MLTRVHITTLLLLAVIVWAVSLWLSGLPITWADAKPFTITVSALSAMVLIFDRWLWKWRFLRGWFAVCPNLQGSWQVLLKSDWIDPTTKTQIAPIYCVMTIRQTYSQLSGRLFTKESSSYLIAHKIEKQNDGVFQLFATYQNTPDISIRGKRSEIHYGAFVLEVRGDPPTSMVGHYWTDRGTKGSMELTDRIDELLNSHQDGAKHFNFSS